MNEYPANTSRELDDIKARLSAVAADLERVSAVKAGASKANATQTLPTEDDVDRMIENPHAGIDFAVRDLYNYMIERGRLRLPTQDENFDPLAKKVAELAPSEKYFEQLIPILLAFVKEDVEDTTDYRWLMLVFALLVAVLVFLSGNRSIDRAINAIVSGGIYWVIWEIVNRILPVPNRVTSVIGRCVVIFVLQFAMGVALLAALGRMR